MNKNGAYKHKNEIFKKDKAERVKKYYLEGRGSRDEEIFFFFLPLVNY